jgi:hypothetical protein
VFRRRANVCDNLGIDTNEVLMRGKKTGESLNINTT